MPETTLPNCLCYDELVEAEDGDFAWVAVDENQACGLCYTSGTTGNPKGVVYSHRSNVIHGLAAAGADAIGARSTDNILPVVPMFHANAWALVFAAPMAGAKMVMPGPKLDGESIYELLDSEKVSITAAVPTVWLMLLQHLEKTGVKLPHLKRVIIGGSAVPRVMLEKFERDYEVEVVHAWGMTELSPVGTLASFKSGMEDLSFDQQMDIKVKQGRPIYTVEMKITDDDGHELPRDGKAFGHLMVRGPAIARAYLKGEGGKVLDDEGWFDTGDVATLDELGFMQITDRAKDVIKSGGEWISSIEIENLAIGHSGDRGSRGHRHRPSEVGRAPAADRRPGRGRQPVEGRHPVLHGRKDRQVVDAGRRRLRRRAPPHRDRQDPETDAAKAIRELRVAHREVETADER